MTDQPDQQQPSNGDTPGDKNVQLGVKDGKIYLGVHNKPVLAMTAPQAAFLAAHLIRHASVIAAGVKHVEDALDKFQPPERG